MWAAWLQNCISEEVLYLHDYTGNREYSARKGGSDNLESKLKMENIRNVPMQSTFVALACF